MCFVPIGLLGLSARAREQMERSRALIDRLAAGDEPIYAVNTGVGLLANVRIPRDELDQLQRNVIRSHCVGVGEPSAREAVRAMMLIRANVLAKGFSGIRPLVAERLSICSTEGSPRWSPRRAASAPAATWRPWPTWRWC